jgi:hypothetical protein
MLLGEWFLMFSCIVVPLKYWEPLTHWCSITSWKTLLPSSTAVRTLNLAWVFFLLYIDTILYIKLKVCLFVSLYLIQTHISEPIWTKLCTHLPLGLEETVGYVWSENVWPFLSGVSAESSARNGCWRKSSATALCLWFLLLLVWRHGNDVVDSFTFLLEVSCTMGNAQKTRRSEWNACV